MTHILSIDSSTSVCSVALHQNGKLVAHTETFLERSHSRNITHMTNELLALCEFSNTQLDAIAVSAGPGSYTGMRIGISTAKGYCFGFDKPLISVSSLYAIAAQLAAQVPGMYYIPMIDARRMEVYCAVYDEHLNEVMREQAHIITEESFREQIQSHNVFIGGSGSEKFKEINHAEDIRYNIGAYPSASCMGTKALQKFEAGLFEDIAYFEPNYLKEFYTK
jgi:tRNA threonylcarbamoyladenosine biosynthesis protein TsaB